MNKEIILMPGDTFGTYSHKLIAHSINVIQWIWSNDSKAVYNHTGIIQNAEGKTLEASLWTISEPNLFEESKGEQVIIARYNGCSLEKKKQELENLKAYHLKQWYPWWRLFMHIIPPLAKVNIFKRPVCSELTARYLYFIGARHEHWSGTRPDTLVDEWVKWKEFDILFEGNL